MYARESSNPNQRGARCDIGVYICVYLIDSGKSRDSRGHVMRSREKNVTASHMSSWVVIFVLKFCSCIIFIHTFCFNL